MSKPKDLYLVTKHYGEGMAYIIDRAIDSKRRIDRVVTAASRSKGKFAGSCKVRVWALINEREAGEKK